MQPALMVLKSAGSGLGITKPFEMFWACLLYTSGEKNVKHIINVVYPICGLIAVHSSYAACEA